MMLRWGRRSTGGVVKAGYGGWSLHFGLGAPALSYVNPDTGDGATCVDWNLRHAWRFVRATAARQARRRELAAKYGWEFADEWAAAAAEEAGA